MRWSVQFEFNAKNRRVAAIYFVSVGDRNWATLPVPSMYIDLNFFVKFMRAAICLRNNRENMGKSISVNVILRRVGSS